MSKPEKGNWDTDFQDDNENKSQDTRPKTLYMDMTKPGSYKVRLVGPHINCRKQFKPYKATVQDNEKEINPAWMAGFVPGRRSAINVIDRADGKLKILEKGPSVFKQFANYKKVFGKDPAGKDGPDFLVEVKIPMLNGKPNKMKTEYAVTHLKETPFTEADKKVIFKTNDKGEIVKDADGKGISNLWPLTEIYKSTSAEKMKEMWDSLPQDKKIAPKKTGDESDDDDDGSSKETKVEEKPVEEKMTGAPAEKDDLFDTDDKDDKDGEASPEMF